MTGAQPSLLGDAMEAWHLVLEWQRVTVAAAAAAAASEPRHVHLHAVVEGEDGGGAGGGRALLQVPDALVEVLPRQQQGFGRQVL